MYLWRAVDSTGEILGIPCQPKQGKAAALKLMRKLLKKQGYTLCVHVTDKRPSTEQPNAGWGFRLVTSRVWGEQSGVNLTSGGAKSRAEDVGLQGSRISPAVPLPLLRRLQHLKPPAPSRSPPFAAPPQGRGRGVMASCNCRRLNEVAYQPYCCSVSFL